MEEGQSGWRPTSTRTTSTSRRWEERRRAGRRSERLPKGRADRRKGKRKR